MRVKVLKEMPFAKVDEIFPLDTTGALHFSSPELDVLFHPHFVEKLLKNRWLELEE